MGRGAAGRGGLHPTLNGVGISGQAEPDPPLSLRDIPCLRWGKPPRSGGERDLAAASGVGEGGRGVRWFMPAELVKESFGFFVEIVGERLVRVVSDVFF